MAGQAYIGISGWRYASWRGDFYPVGLRQRDELAYAATRFGSIELNGSFYSLQRPSSYLQWRSAVPEGFVFALKGGRFITHLKRLREPTSPLANFFASGPLALGQALGPVLWQLPAAMPFDAPLLEDFLALLPRSTAQAADLGALHDDRLASDRVYLHSDATEAGSASDRPILHALEMRSRDWANETCYDLLRRNRVALVVSDGGAAWPQFDVQTGPIAYLRLHGHSQLYVSRYSTASLERWAERIRELLAGSGSEPPRDVYVYFDNDSRGHAPHDAERLQRMLDG